MIGVVGYGLGNVRAILAAYAGAGVEAVPVGTPGEVRLASKLVLPGIGAFDHALDRLDALDLIEPLRQRVEVDGIPILGICVGMQLFASSSEEGTRPGLGWIPGEVRRLTPPANGERLPVPHMGWNRVDVSTKDGLFEGLEESRFYFLHSFHMACRSETDVLATTRYGSTFACAVRRKNVWGVQFHPEKSHGFGVKLLRNFSRS